MTCDQINLRIDAVLDGDEAWTSDARAHLDTCSRCQSRVALAQGINRWLPQLPVDTPPATFTSGVMARVRRERWRAEQALDAGFNVAIAAGLLLIVAGVAGLAWSSGLIVVGADVVALMREAIAVTGAEIAPQLPTYSVAALLLTMGLGVWWWTEHANFER
ncbi:MAG: hypothetical protein Q8L86_07450 [Vicinamibacterales bacterium]|nr:hypothetical protein [Vicinamibacterales bacterium]